MKPLDGIKVLDFTHGVAGPYCTTILGDLGAHVIKVEKPKNGDPTRYMNMTRRFNDNIPDVGGDYFLGINRNKQSIGINLKEEAGRQICLDLAEWADVAVQNFSPGVMQRLGLDYSALSARNPNIIYANISAYGKGPLADKPGMDVAVQARAGIMASTGIEDSHLPVKPSVSLADFGGGIFLTTGILAALIARQRSGKGSEVDVSLLDATMSMLSNYAVSVMDGDAAMRPLGSGHPQLVPYQAFPTADGSVVISAGTNKIFRHLCEAFNRRDLTVDERFASNQERVVHRHALIQIINEITKTKNTQEWITIFEAARVPCAPVNTMREAFEQLAVTSPAMVVPIDHAKAGTLHLTGVPFRFSNMHCGIETPAPMLGEHTLQILKNVANYDDEKIANLVSSATISEI